MRTSNRALGSPAGVFAPILLTLTVMACAFAEGQPAAPNQWYETTDPIGSAFNAISNSALIESINTWPPELYVVVLDFNHDGRSDLLITANFFTNGKAGEMWYVFKKADTGFMGYMEPVVFSYWSSQVRQNATDGTTSILDSQTGGGKKAALTEITLSDNGVEQQVVRRYNWEEDDDVRHWESISETGQPLRTFMRRMNFGPLMQEYSNDIEEILRDRAKNFDNPRKELPINYRNPEYADQFVDSVEELYALVDGQPSAHRSGENVASTELPADDPTTEDSAPLTIVDNDSEADHSQSAADTTPTIDNEPRRQSPDGVPESKLAFWFTGPMIFVESLVFVAVIALVVWKGGK